MGLLRRTPPAVRAVALEPGERRVGWGLDADGAPVVATDRALLLPGGERLPWPRVEHAAWQRPRLQVRMLAESPPFVVGAGPSHEVVLSEEGDVPEAVHSQVTGAVAWSQRVTLAPEAGARLVARRLGPDELEWQVVYDVGVDAHDPVLQERAGLALDQARRTIG